MGSGTKKVPNAFLFIGLDERKEVLAKYQGMRDLLKKCFEPLLIKQLKN